MDKRSFLKRLAVGAAGVVAGGLGLLSGPLSSKPTKQRSNKWKPKTPDLIPGWTLADAWHYLTKLNGGKLRITGGEIYYPPRRA